MHAYASRKYFALVKAMLSDWDVIDSENQQVFTMQGIAIAMQHNFSMGEKGLEMVFMELNYMTI